MFSASRRAGEAATSFTEVAVIGTHVGGLDGGRMDPGNVEPQGYGGASGKGDCPPTGCEGPRGRDCGSAEHWVTQVQMECDCCRRLTLPTSTGCTVGGPSSVHLFKSKLEEARLDLSPAQSLYRRRKRAWGYFCARETALRGKLWIHLSKRSGTSEKASSSGVERSVGSRFEPTGSCPTHAEGLDLVSL